MTKISDQPTDAVIIWVDGTDPAWRKEKESWEQKETLTQRNKEWNSGDIRYRDWGLLPYWFRGIEEFAPWIRKVHFVTWGHLPSFLNTDHPKLHIVNHQDYIPKEYLPTFNSHTIELNIHHIEGLAEQFIYFNDDMFLTAQTTPEDFFRNGLPCDSAILNPVPMTRWIEHAEINNIGIINDHFNKDQVIRNNWSKWYNLRYGKYLIRNFLLSPWHSFVGLYEQHLPTSFLKNTFETLWNIEHDELDATCRFRFRNRENVNQWLMKNWQIAEGNFTPRRLKIGKMYMYGEKDNYEKVCKEVSARKWKMICINDYQTDNYEKRRKQLEDAFAMILPQKSSFEK